MKVLKNYLWNMSYQLFVLIIPFITIPYVSRVIGVSGLGISAYTASIVQYFVLLGGLGFSLYGNREIAYNRDSSEKITLIFWELFYLRIITMGVSIIIFIFFSFFYKEYTYFLLLQIGTLVAVIFDISWFFMGMENFKITVIRNSVIKIVSVILIFIFVKSKEDLPLYIVIMSCSVLLGNLTLFPYLKRYITFKKISELNIFKHLGSVLFLMLPQLSINIYIVLNKTMLGYISGIEDAAFFDNSDKIIKIVLTVVTSLGLVMLPHISNSFSKKDFGKIRTIIIHSIDFVMILSIPIMCGLISIADEFAIWFLGNDFSDVGNIIMIQSLAIPFMALSNVLGTQYLLPAKKNKEYTIAVTLGAVINLLVNIPLIYYFGALGAAVSSVITEFTVFIFEFVIVSQNMNISHGFKELWKYLLGGLIMIFILKNVNFNISSTTLNLFINVFLGVLIYLMLLIITKAKFLNTILIKIKNRRAT